MSENQFILSKISDLILKLKSGAGFGNELLTNTLERISRMDGRIGSFVTLNPELSPEAGGGDLNWQELSKTKLAGLPVAIKDIFDTSGILTSYGSSIFQSHIPKKDSVIVSKIRDSGGLILGKTRTHEFALSITTPGCHNPWDLDRIAGGSSGGSAAAVAAGLAHVATGSDTGGSIRIPASMCGVVGFKPTYRSLSMKGIFPEAPSLDHAGVFCRYASDLPVLLSSMGMKLPAERNRKVWRIVLLDDLFQRADSKVSRTVFEQVELMESEGLCRTERSSIKGIEECWETVDLIDVVESSRVHKTLMTEHSGDYLPNSKAAIEAGLKVSDDKYRDAKQKQKECTLEVYRLLRRHDFIISPTQPDIAPAISEASKMSNEDLDRYLEFTKIFNLSHDPAISLPAGFVNGLPIGMQIVGMHGSDMDIISFAEQYQQLTEWHKAVPPMAL